MPGSLLDLLGTSIVTDTKGWTPIGKNTRLIWLEGIRSGKQTITVTAPRKPGPGGPIRTGIGPNHLLIDLEMANNVRELKIEQQRRREVS